MRSMRRSISLEDLGLATDAPKLTSLLFAKALSFEGKEAMRALVAALVRQGCLDVDLELDL